MRRYYPPLAFWLRPDPLMDDNISLSSYAYCNGNPLIFVDPEGEDWYLNSETNYYTWFNGNSKRDNFIYVGPKGCLFGDLESTLDKALEHLCFSGLYTDGFTFDITPTDKGALIASKERDWDFLDEFCFNEGPEFSILLGNHPYTQQMMNDANVGLGQNKVRKENTFSETLRKWTPLSVLNPRNWKMAPQFIGSYIYFGEPSKDGEHINNVIYDSKNVRSLFLHIPHSSWNQPRSVYQNRFGNTYQFYVWQSSK